MTLSGFFKKTATAAMALLCFSSSLEAANDKLKIHYARPDKVYDNLGIWFWDHVKNPSKNWPTGATKPSGKDKFGIFFEVALNSNPSQVSFLILDTKEGKKIEENKTIYLTDKREVWVVADDVNVYDTEDLKIKSVLRQAIITGEDELELRFNKMDDLDVKKLAKNLKIENTNKKIIKVSSVSSNGNSNAMVILNSTDTPGIPARVSFDGRHTDVAFDWKYIDRSYAYNGNDLGCTMNGDDAVIKLWAPLAENVDIILFDKDNQNKQILKKSMIKGENGVWTIILTLKDLEKVRYFTESLRGFYYQFEVKNIGKDPVRVLDPYARSMAAVTVDSDASDGGSTHDLVGKAAIVDLNAIKPETTKVEIEGYNRAEDAIIYEVHVRDFTSDPAIEEHRTGRFGSFKAFIGRLPYLKSLGVTHIQLLPVMAWYYGDELKMAKPEYAYKAKGCNYNWGYDPQNYFSPDGAYSENPNDAELRISELRKLINAIHAEGMGVILDVVYTHMANATFLNNVVPDYYFFKDANGNFVGDFGNNLATTRKMASKLLVDSVKYWFKEYGIDGMRWDMMGDATADAVQKAFNEAKKINPNVIFIGEGWRTFKGDREDPSLAGKGADQGWMCKTRDVGSFSDEMRNELKSGFMSEGEPAFISGGVKEIQKIFRNIKGDPTNFETLRPANVVQYIEAHDNLTVFDVIAKATKLDPEIPANYEELHKRIRLGLGLVLTSQGVAFIHAGQEYGRTKQWLADSVPEQKYFKFVDASGKDFKHPYFIHDSYDSSDAVNKFDWTKATNAEVSPVSCESVEYTKGLIALRKSTDAFRLGSKKFVDNYVKLLAIPELNREDLAIAYSCRSFSNKDVYYIFVNCDKIKRSFTPLEEVSKGEVIVDGKRAGVKKIEKPYGVEIKEKENSVVLEPLTFAVIRVKSNK